MRKELIKISEFQRRRWGENGTPPCPQAIRNYIRNGQLRVSKLESSGISTGPPTTKQQEMT